MKLSRAAPSGSIPWYDWGRCTHEMLDLLLSMSELPFQPSTKPPPPPIIPVLEALGLGVTM